VQLTVSKHPRAVACRGSERLRVYLASAIRPCAGDHAEHRRGSNGPQGRGRCVFRVQKKPRALSGALLRARPRAREDRGRNENGRHVESPRGYTATAAVAARMQGALALFGGGERAWTDTALSTESSPGRGTLSAEAGGSGRGSTGEGNCSSLHIEMYLGIRVVSCTTGVKRVAGASLKRCSSGSNQAAVVPCWRSCSAW
jgi:hypothetical protein